MWAKDNYPALLPKTKGSRIMVANFVDVYNGYPAPSPDEQAMHPTTATTSKHSLNTGMTKKDIGPVNSLWHKLRMLVTLQK